jgi:hypothetical protein
MRSPQRIYFALVFLCFLVYFNTLKNGFVSDDIDAIVNNPLVSRPLYYWLYPSMLLNSLSYALVRLNPLAYHLTNILLHALATLLVFFFLRLFFKTEACFWGASLFAVHPIHTEAVSWISGRPYIMTTLFMLAGYFLYYFAVDSINPFKAVDEDPVFYKPGDATGTRFKPLPYGIGLVLFCYYLIRNFNFCFLFPFLLVLSDMTFGRWKKNWKYWIPFLAAAGIRVLLAVHLVAQRIREVRGMWGFRRSKIPSFFSCIHFHPILSYCSGRDH